MTKIVLPEVSVGGLRGRFQGEVSGVGLRGRSQGRSQGEVSGGGLRGRSQGEVSGGGCRGRSQGGGLRAHFWLDFVIQLFDKQKLGMTKNELLDFLIHLFMDVF